MIKLMDRQLIFGYFKSYIVCLTSLLSLWVVVDLFTNLDDFTRHHRTFLALLEHVGGYYGFRMTKIFDQLSEPIVLLAAMFTIAWMQRCNEQFPLLSAGVSTRRIVLPVLLCATFMLGLAVVNQEFIIPRVATRLSFDKDDPSGEKELSIQGQCFEPNGIHIGGKTANRKKQTVSNFECVIPKELAEGMLVVTAPSRRWISSATAAYWT
jgi:lipopolysaccharide export system permease protein